MTTPRRAVPFALAPLAAAFAAVFAAVLTAAAALGGEDGDVLSNYRKRYAKDSFLSEKEDVIRELQAAGRPEARKALLWCASVSKEAIADRRKEADKIDAKLRPVIAEFDEKWRELCEQERKQGRPPPTSVPIGHPVARLDGQIRELRADLERAERSVLEERKLLAAVLDAHGALVAKLPDDAQRAVRDEWLKGGLADKDWGVRAEHYDLLAHTPVEWAFLLLRDAAGTEPDPRALVRILDGLGGREPTRVVPILAERLKDARWTVRAAALAALERTPSRETIDAIVAHMPEEEGRLLDDCARALRTLTGAELPSNPEMWRRWWEANRAGGGGPPPPKPADKPPSALEPPPDVKKKEDPRRTGFFGIETKSRRLVYVIDVSGSMNEKAAAASDPDRTTRAELAKRELKQAITALEDGALFDILFFSAAVTAWKPDMVVADAKTRRAANEFVDAVQVIGGTNTYDALEAAFALADVGKGRRREADPTGDAKVDTIILLSDGKPSLGRTTDPEKIRAAVKEWNLARRITLHTVAFGADADQGFMRGLAEDSGGTFRAR